MIRQGITRFFLCDSCIKMCIYLCIFVDNDTAMLHNSFVLEENVIMKEFVVIKFVEAAGYKAPYRIWASYPGDIWGSPIYEVIDYFPTREEAQAAI